MKLKVWFSSLVAAVLVSSIAGAHPVMYCRDCPFPAKIGDGRYLMPNGLVTVELQETPMRDGMNQVGVILRDTKTGHIVAIGEVVQRRERRTAYLDLTDNQGHKIEGFLRFVEGREKIQAKFSCESCTIGSMLE